MSEKSEDAFCCHCMQVRLCEVQSSISCHVWICKECGHIADEDWLDECDSMAEQQAELEDWGEL